jgi:hypothetical protein
MPVPESFSAGLALFGFAFFKGAQQALAFLDRDLLVGHHLKDFKALLFHVNSPIEFQNI